jgi:hypothetical protein
MAEQQGGHTQDHQDNAQHCQIAHMSSHFEEAGRATAPNVATAARVDGSQRNISGVR